MLACGAGDDPHRRHRRSQAEDVVRIGPHHYRAAMRRRHGDRMGINDVLRIRADTMKDRPNAASEIEVRWDYANRGPCGTGLSPRRDSATTPTPARHPAPAFQSDDGVRASAGDPVEYPSSSRRNP